jgi:hypothetical protein
VTGKVCDECAKFELESLQQLRTVGLPFLAKRYVPDEEFSIIGLGHWKTLAATASGLASRAVLIAFTGFLGSVLSSNFRPRKAGFIGLTSKELYLVETKELTNETDALDYQKLWDLRLPPSYSHDRTLMLAKVTKCPLDAVKAFCDDGSVASVVTFSGGIEAVVTFPQSYAPGNETKGRLITDAIILSRGAA